MNEVTTHATPQRLAFVIEALTVGGAEQMLVVLANGFTARGAQVHMICLTRAGELAEQLDSAVHLHILDKAPGIDMGLPRRFRQLIRKINPTAINSHLWVANTWSRASLIGMPYRVIATEHSRDHWKPLYYRRIDRLLARKTRALVAVSEDTAEFYRADIGIDARLIHVINNGVDTRRYAAGNGETLRREWGVADQVLIGTVGRLVSAKNHHRFLEVADLTRDSLPHARFVIVGDGPEREALEHTLKQMSLQTRVLLAGARSDIPDVLQALDVFVLTSDREGHPLTALEAQAAGTPVVLTAVGGCADAIAHSGAQVGGLLVEPKTAAIAEAVVRLAGDEPYRLALADFAASHAAQFFDSAQMIDRYNRLFSTTG